MATRRGPWAAQAARALTQLSHSFVRACPPPVSASARFFSGRLVGGNWRMRPALLHRTSSASAWPRRQDARLSSVGQADDAAPPRRAFTHESAYRSLERL